MLSLIPLMLIPLVLYNLIAMGFIGSSGGTPFDAHFFSMNMMSGGTFTMTLGDLLFLISLILLYFRNYQVVAHLQRLYHRPFAVDSGVRGVFGGISAGQVSSDFSLFSADDNGFYRCAGRILGDNPLCGARREYKLTEKPAIYFRSRVSIFLCIAAICSFSSDNPSVSLGAAGGDSSVLLANGVNMLRAF